MIIIEHRVSKKKNGTGQFLHDDGRPPLQIGHQICRYTGELHCETGDFVKVLDYKTRW